jgi:hypothetical protein
METEMSVAKALTLLQVVQSNQGSQAMSDTNDGTAGAPPARRRRDRVYINIDGRVVFFANEANAREYLEEKAAEVTRRFEREAERIEAEVSQEQHDAPAGAMAPVDWRTIPIRIPKIVVDGNEDLEQLARETETRFYAWLMVLEGRRRQLQWEDELLLLS